MVEVQKFIAVVDEGSALKYCEKTLPNGKSVIGSEVLLMLHSHFSLCFVGTRYFALFVVRSTFPMRLQ